MSGIEERLTVQRNKPLMVSIMGQTGVGKSSLLNALFNLELDVDPVRPTTREIKPIPIKNARGHTIIFYDMPGIGESEEADSNHLEHYRRHLIESDLVLWANHADNRSITFDQQILRRLFDGIGQAEHSELISKITFVLTKADMLVESPWKMGCIDNYATFTPGKATKYVLDRKALYYQERLIQPHGSYIVSRTYNDAQFTLDDSSFSYTEHSVFYHGLLSRDRVESLKSQYHKFARIFERLYDNYRVIPCSAHFKYNLPDLMLVVLNKLGPRVFESFKQAVNVDEQSVDIELLDRVPIEKARKLCNICIVDVPGKRTVFDLSEGTFPPAGVYSQVPGGKRSFFSAWSGKLRGF